jgi:K+-sensing histidine kinase KdpD
VEKHLRSARSLQIETRIVSGKDIAKAVVEYARQHKVTQIFVAQSQTGIRERLRGRISRTTSSAWLGIFR